MSRKVVQARETKAVVTEAIYGGNVPAEHAEWTVATLLENLVQEGVVQTPAERVFLQILPGNTATSLSLIYAESKQREVLQLRDRILQVVTAAIGEGAAAHLLIECYPEVEGMEMCPPKGEPSVRGEHEMQSDGDDGNSIDSEPSIEPYLRKSPPEQMLGMEQRIDRLEIFAEKLELIISKVGNMDTKLDRFSVLLTEVSTEISDLRSSSSSLKECLTCDRSPTNKQLIGNQLRSELKDTFTEVLLEVRSEDQSGNQKEADQEVVQRFLPKIIQGLQSAEGQADKAWIVDHGEAFADQLATKVASAVAKEVQAQEVDMNELNSVASEFRSLVGMMKSKLAVVTGAGANQGQLSTVPEEQHEYRPPSPTTPPEEQDFMTPPAGIADQASKGADMTLESAIRHLNGEAAAAVPAAVQENGSDDDTIVPKDDGEQRGRTAARAMPEANETQA
jgi:hypothetical protein